MDTSKCLDVLLHGTARLAEQHRVLAEFLQSWQREFPFFRTATACRYALGDLRNKVARSDRARLDTRLAEIAAYSQQQLRRDIAEGQLLLRSLQPGSKIVIAHNGTERTLTFVALRRTRFLARDERGHLVTVSTAALVATEKEVPHAT